MSMCQVCLVNALSFKYADDPNPKYGGTIVIMDADFPITLNPAITPKGTVHGITSKIFNGLVLIDFDLTAYPDLATDWEVSEDQLQWTFHLVDNATWHDGVKFTSADVKFSWEEVLMKHHASNMRLIAPAIESIETPDDYTVVFNLNYPYPEFLIMAGKNHYATIIPKHLYEGTDPLTNPHNMDPVGTGPFMVKSMVEGDSIELVRNPNYFKEGLPYLDGIIFKVIPDPLVAAIALETGAVDFDYRKIIPLNEITRLIELPDINPGFTHLLSLAGWGLAINVREAPLDNVLVRKAMSHALDRDFIIESVFGGYGDPLQGPYSAYHPCHDPEVQVYEYDTAIAEQLLDDAGYPRGEGGIRFSIEISVNTGEHANVGLSELVEVMFEEVGIDVTLKIMEQTTFQEYVYMTHDFDIACYGDINTGPSLEQPRIMFHSENILKIPSQVNIGGYNNSRVDELFDTALLEQDRDTKIEYYNEIESILVDEVPYLWVWDSGSSNAFVHRAEWHGIPTNIDKSRSHMERVWWEYGTLPELEPEPDVDDGADVESRVEEIEDVLEELSSAISDVETQLSDMGSLIDDIQADLDAPASTSNTMVYLSLAVSIVAVALAFYFGTKK